MLQWIMIAGIALFNALVCFNYFGMKQGSFCSFLIWQILLATSIILIVVFWKRLSGIKPH